MRARQVGIVIHVVVIFTVVFYPSDHPGRAGASVGLLGCCGRRGVADLMSLVASRARPCQPALAFFLRVILVEARS
jgi:hypothetical protein